VLVVALGSAQQHQTESLSCDRLLRCTRLHTVFQVG
jgi:hypothetical protein